MASTKVRISAYISAETKELVDRYAEEHELKRGHLLEEALLHHLQALRELPTDVLIPSRVVVSKASWKNIERRRTKPRRPTAAMRKLFSKR